MERTRALAPAALLNTRAGRALRRPQNWIELAKFCVVGVSGYLVNLGFYVVLLRAADLHYLPAAACSFVVAVTNNYFWNRRWPLRGRRGHACYQWLPFLGVWRAARGASA